MSWHTTLLEKGEIHQTQSNIRDQSSSSKPFEKEDTGSKIPSSSKFANLRDSVEGETDC